MERAAPEARRNYNLLVAEGILFTVGFVFVDPTTVVPLLMERLTGSVLLVGLVAAVQPLSKGLVPIVAGNWITGLEQKRPWLVATMSTSRLPLWLLAAALVFVRSAPVWAWAALLFVVQLLFWAGDSAGDPAWMDMVGKAVPPGRRGRFFATRQIAGGLLSIGAGAAVAAILGSDSLGFPRAYGIVVAIGALCYLANVGTFVGLVEEPGPAAARLDLRVLVRSLPQKLRAHPGFGRLMAVLILFNLARLSLPFYVVVGVRELGLGEAALGLFIPLQMAGRVAGAVTWGSIGDRKGHHRSVQLASLAAALPPVIAFLTLATGTGGTARLSFAVLFVILGFAIEGWPAFINHMLDVVPERERPLYAGLMGIGSIPAALAPVVGGVLAGLAGYAALFGVTAAVVGAACVTALGLRSASRPPSG